MKESEAAKRAGAGVVALGLRLRALRAETGQTLSQVSERTGVSISYLSDIERGRRLPALDVLDRLCHGYGLLVADALDGVYPYGASRGPRRLTPPPDGRRATG